MELQLDETFVKERLETTTINWWVKACEAFGMDWQKYPAVSFTENTAKAGCAPMKINSMGTVLEYGVQINLPLALESEENYQEFINQVIPHEVCHIIARMFFPMDTDHHGWAWKAVMIKMGKNPDRTHNMDVSTISNRSYEYKCPDCGQKYYVGKVKHNRIQNGRWVRCGVCHSNSPLRFMKNHEVEQDRFI